MDKVIIGVHGLANKPEPEDLAAWWRRSLEDGLRNLGVAQPRLAFELVYWASALYKQPLHTDELYSFDALYNDEPYTPPTGLKTYDDGWIDLARATVTGFAGSVLDAARLFGENPLQTWLLGKLLKDLAFYYDRERMLKLGEGKEVARVVLDGYVRHAVRAAKGKRIMLVAHSMGSIIAYNALRDLGREDPELAVEHFVTIGSPLGLPYVKGRIIEERDYDPVVRTPSIVTGTWFNFADKDDPVATDERLRDDYSENARGVRVVDDLIFNDYQSPKGKRNAHKSYGYLRAPEFSEHVKAFLSS